MRPEINSTWIHDNGNCYTVIFYTNENTTKGEYPLSIVYKDNTGKLYSHAYTDDWWYSKRKLLPLNTTFKVKIDTLNNIFKRNR